MLGDSSGKGVVDLCLDHALIKDDYPDRFDHIQGLSAFPDLEDLSISMHELDSLKGLPELHLLKRLNLSQNQLQELEGFPQLDGLKFLDLSLNELQSLKGLPSLPALRELHISFNHLLNLDHLPELANLKVLTASGNRPLKDLRMLVQCPSLQELYLSNCFIPDWKVIKDLENLRLLTASPANPLVLEPLKDTSSLESLKLHAKRMGEVVYFPPLKRLKHLTIKGGSQVKHIRGLELLEGLEGLELQKNGLEEIPLMPKSLLRSLDLSHNPIRSLKGLESFPNLVRLGLGRTLVQKEELESFEMQHPEVEIFWN